MASAPLATAAGAQSMSPAGASNSGRRSPGRRRRKGSCRQEITGKNKKDGGVTGRVLCVFPHGGAAFQIPQKEQGACRQGRKRGGQGRMRPVREGVEWIKTGPVSSPASRTANSSAGMMRGEVQGTRCHSPVISRKTGIISRMCLSADAAKTRAAFPPGEIPPSMWPRARAPHVRYGRRPALSGSVSRRSNLPGHCTFARAAASLRKGRGGRGNCLMVSSARAAFSR